MMKQWKGFISGILATVLVLGFVFPAYAAYQKQATLNYNDIKITMNGKQITPTDANGNAVEPFVIEGSTYLPVRAVANALDLTVGWDDATKTVSLTNGDAPAETVAPAPTQNGTTMGQKNALKTAKKYLEFTAFSYTSLIEQLEYEEYSTEDATYAANNCGADWNEQATKKAKKYLDFSSFSRNSLIEQLEYEGFTHEQAVYGAEANGY